MCDSASSSDSYESGTATESTESFDESSSVHVFVLPALLRDFVPTVNIILYVFLSV